MTGPDSAVGERPMRTTADRRTMPAVVATVGLALLVPLYAQRSGAPGPATPVMAVALLDTARDSLLVSDKEYQGWKWFHVYCFRCHGIDALGGSFAPDLRHSVGPQGSVTHDVFLQTVTNGRPTKGMPTWGALLDSTQIEELYAYVMARSQGRLAPGRPHRASDQ